MSVSDYRSICQKGELENYLFDKYVVRRISIYFTIPLIWVGASPNQATFASLIALMISVAAFAFNSPIALYAAAAFLFTYYMLDHVDGELARYYSVRDPERNSGLSGQYFDVLCHSYSGNFIMLTCSYALYREYGYGWIMPLGFVASMGISSFPSHIARKVWMQAIARDPGKIHKDNFIKVLNALERKGGQISAMRASFRDVKKWKKMVVEFFGFPGFLVVLMAAALLDAYFQGFHVAGIEMNFRLLVVMTKAAQISLRTIIIARKLFRLLGTVGAH